MSKSFNNVDLTAINAVDKPHLKGKPLYVAVFADPNIGTIEAEVGLREPDKGLYVIGKQYDIEVEEKFGTMRLKGIALTGQALGPPQAPASGGNQPRYKDGKESGGKPFPLPLLHGDRSIIRQNSSTQANALFDRLFQGKKQDTLKGIDALDHAAAVVNVARVFEEYAAGDKERVAAEQARGDAKDST